MAIVKRIVTAKDYAVREGAKSTREMVKRWSGRMYRSGQLDTPFIDGPTSGTPLIARVNHGQWTARCDQCNTPMWVDPDDPFLYCYGCGNRVTGGKPRAVIFPEPEQRMEIERLLIERPVDDRKGTNDIDRAFNAMPLAIGLVGGELIVLDRSWNPGESVETLCQQNMLIETLVGEREALGLIPGDGAPIDAYKESIAYFSAKRDTENLGGAL